MSSVHSAQCLEEKVIRLVSYITDDVGLELDWCCETIHLHRDETYKEDYVRTIDVACKNSLQLMHHSQQWIGGGERDNPRDCDNPHRGLWHNMTFAGIFSYLIVIDGTPQESDNEMGEERGLWNPELTFLQRGGRTGLDLHCCIISSNILIYLTFLLVFEIPITNLKK